MNAINHNLIINCTDISVFDAFNGEYSKKAIEICSLLQEFQIRIVCVCESPYAKKLMVENDAFGYYMEVNSGKASNANAEIIVNPTMCDRLGLTDREMLAAVAHEVGHIMFYFHTEKDKYNGNIEEMICDSYACRMGLKDEMISLLKKMVESGECSQNQVKQFKLRINYINLV